VEGLKGQVKKMARMIEEERLKGRKNEIELEKER
jgi:hypothetical protein